jgi:hypothetical protein
MAEPLLKDVISSPEWVPHTFDVQGANLTFVHVPRDARSDLMFLSDEHFAGNYPKIAFPADAVAAQAASVETAPIHFIFHTSYCCSTLLAKALDVPGTSMVLKEPDVLINLANRLIRSDDPGNRQRAELVLKLLERPFDPNEAVIVKPTNFANRLVDTVLAQRPSSRAVLLYSDVETFLRSLLKRGMFGRIFGRRLFTQLSGWSPMEFGYRPDELLQQTDVQIAALAWLMQIAHFDLIARAFGPQRVMVIDSANLLANPEAVLGEVQSLFGLGLDGDAISAIASGPVFSRHSKFADRDYDAASRAEEHEAASKVHSEELGMVVQWLQAVAAEIGAPLRPGL